MKTEKQGSDMEIIVTKGDLCRELQLVQGIVERKNSIPILSNVLVRATGGGLEIAATDLDVSLRCGCPAQVAKEGSIALGAKKLYEIARALPDSAIHLTVFADSWTTIECESVTFKMAGFPGEDFPSLPSSQEGSPVELDGKLLGQLIERTSFAITGEDARYYLAGALLLVESDAVGLVATDGHRLSYARAGQKSTGQAEETRILVPRKAIHELARLLELGERVTFQRVENHLVFSVAGRTLYSKTVEGQFPSFEKVTGLAGDKKVEVGTEALATAVRRVSLLSAERSRAIRVGLSNDTLEVSASSPELGEAREQLKVQYAGADLQVGFNAQYLLDFLAVVGAERVRLELSSQEGRALLVPQHGPEQPPPIDYRYVVMPMRI